MRELLLYGTKRGALPFYSAENFQSFRRNQVGFEQLSALFDLPMDGTPPCLFGSLALTIRMVQQVYPRAISFFPGVAEKMVEFQVKPLVDKIEPIKKNMARVK